MSQMTMLKLILKQFVSPEISAVEYEPMQGVDCRVAAFFDIGVNLANKSLQDGCIIYITRLIIKTIRDSAHKTTSISALKFYPDHQDEAPRTLSLLPFSSFGESVKSPNDDLTHVI
jgi:hypothetical protein